MTRRLVFAALCRIAVSTAGWPAEARDLHPGMAVVDITPPVGVPLAGYSARRLSLHGAQAGMKIVDTLRAIAAELP